VAGLRANVPPLPSIVTDSRERTPLTFANLPTVAGTLVSGDYSIRGLEDRFAVERKSPADLVGSVGRERDRFTRELHRLRGFDFARLLVVGSPADVVAVCRGMNPRAVFASLAAIEARGIPIVWQPDPTAAASWVERVAFWFWRESLKPAGVKLETPGWAILSH
jgi:ERCC4-type nuclease